MPCVYSGSHTIKLNNRIKKCFTPYSLFAKRSSTITLNYSFSDHGIAVGHFEPFSSYKPVNMYVMSPELEVGGPSCLEFLYRLTTSLTVKWISKSDTRTLASFRVNSGNEFQEAFIELPVGVFNLIFEASGFGAMLLIDDIRIQPGTCSDDSESVMAWWNFRPT